MAFRNDRENNCLEAPVVFTWKILNASSSTEKSESFVILAGLAVLLNLSADVSRQIMID